jgi:hypothetical protein
VKKPIPCTCSVCGQDFTTTETPETICGRDTCQRTLWTDDRWVGAERMAASRQKANPTGIFPTFHVDDHDVSEVAPACRLDRGLTELDREALER